MDLFEDAKGIVRQELTGLGVNHVGVTSLDVLLNLLFNRHSKGVPQRPRKVNRTPLFIQKLGALDPDMLSSAHTIITKIESGDDLSGHLSKGSVDAHSTDPLLADWGIHHLHISDQKKNASDAFYGRTGPVMFVRFGADEALLVDIYPHGKGYPETWTREELLTEIHKTYPDLLEPFKLKGFDGMSSSVTEMQRKKLRAGGVFVPVEIDGNVYFPPGGGITSAKTSVNVQRRVDLLMSSLRDAETRIGSLSAQQLTDLEQKANVRPGHLKIGLSRFSPEEWRVTITGTSISLATIRLSF